MTLLVDTHGHEIYADGVTHDDVRDAIQAAARADDFKLAYEIAERYDWNNVCLHCAATAPTHEFWTQYKNWPVCKPCKEELQPGSTADFSDVKMYVQGLISRDVQ